jgi:hypothetical protein
MGGGSGAGLRVRGGSGGTAVGLDALDEAAGALFEAAQEVTVTMRRVAALALDADLVAGGLLSPTTGIAATDAVLAAAGPPGLAGEVAALLALSASVRTASAAYRAVEAATGAAVEQAQDSVLFVAGRLAPQLVVGTLVLESLGVDVGGRLDHLVFTHPGMADLAGGAEGLVLGLESNPLTRPLVHPSRRRHHVGGLRPEDGREHDYEDGVKILADSAAVWGLLDDAGRAQVVAEPVPRPGASAPTTLRDLASAQRNVDDGQDYPGHVRVIEVPQPRGSVWVVEISGTQAWDPRAGGTPFDVTTDVRLMAHDATVLADGVQQALAQAQAQAQARATPADAAEVQRAPVMLVGHSLGGIAAAGLASSPLFMAQHRVTHVVTMGAPVARMPVPAETQVLSLEHTRDPVPRLDGQPNPDRASWVTVTRDDRGDGVAGASHTHDVRGYVDTAGLVDQSSDPSVVSWRSTSARFFDADAHGEPVIRDYAIRRVRP